MSHSVIIGGTGGIGNSIIKKLVQQRRHVINIDKVPGRITSEFCQNIEYDICNLKDENSKAKLLQLLSEAGCEAIESIICCSAKQKLGTFKDFSSKELEKINFVNSLSQIEIFKTLLNLMRKSKQPSFISINSIHSKLSKKNFFSYSSSKKYLEGLLDSLSLSYADHKIKIIQIFPAAINTKMLMEGLNENEIEKLNSYHPTGIIGNPVELADLVFNIMQIDGAFLNGSKINFDGGIANQLHDPAS